MHRSFSVTSVRSLGRSHSYLVTVDLERNTVSFAKHKRGKEVTRTFPAHTCVQLLKHATKHTQLIALFDHDTTYKKHIEFTSQEERDTFCQLVHAVILAGNRAYRLWKALRTKQDSQEAGAGAGTGTVAATAGGASADSRLTNGSTTNPADALDFVRFLISFTSASASPDDANFHSRTKNNNMEGAAAEASVSTAGARGNMDGALLDSSAITNTNGSGCSASNGASGGGEGSGGDGVAVVLGGGGGERSENGASGTDASRSPSSSSLQSHTVGEHHRRATTGVSLHHSAVMTTHVPTTHSAGNTPRRATTKHLSAAAATAATAGSSSSSSSDASSSPADLLQQQQLDAAAESFGVELLGGEHVILQQRQTSRLGIEECVGASISMSTTQTGTSTSSVNALTMYNTSSRGALFLTNYRLIYLDYQYHSDTHNAYASASSSPTSTSSTRSLSTTTTSSSTFFSSLASSSSASTIPPLPSVLSTDVEVTLGAISRIITKQSSSKSTTLAPQHIRIVCKDLRRIEFAFDCASGWVENTLMKQIQKWAWPKDQTRLFAFSYTGEKHRRGGGVEEGAGATGGGGGRESEGGIIANTNITASGSSSNSSASGLAPGIDATSGASSSSSFSPTSESSTATTSTDPLLPSPTSASPLPLSSPSLPIDGWSLYDPVSDFTRIGLLPHPSYRLISLNSQFTLCPSYPSHFILPAPITDDEVRTIAEYRSQRRLPAVCYLHPLTGASLSRCAQPLTGLTSKRSDVDERLIQLIRITNPTNSSILVILDARPYKAAIGNTVMGKGYERIANYDACALQFMNIDNIHAIRGALEKLMELLMEGRGGAGGGGGGGLGLGGTGGSISITSGGGSSSEDASSWLGRLESTHWLTYIHLVLNAAVRCALLMSDDGCSVLTHCSDGWDRTSQICALTQLMLDPYYRTMAGFAVLIEKEWCSYGHQFAVRTGHADPEYNHDQRAPIFLQFLDCCFQILRQFPTSFEFTPLFLREIYDQLCGCRFGTFLFDCVREREMHRVRDRTVSLWTWLLSDEQRHKYYNDRYAPCMEAEESAAAALAAGTKGRPGVMGVGGYGGDASGGGGGGGSMVMDYCIPNVSMRRLQLWEDMYCRWDRDYVPRTIRNEHQHIASHSAAIKAATTARQQLRHYQQQQQLLQKHRKQNSAPSTEMIGHFVGKNRRLGKNRGESTIGPAVAAGGAAGSGRKAAAGVAGASSASSTSAPGSSTRPSASTVTGTPTTTMTRTSPPKAASVLSLVRQRFVSLRSTMLEAGLDPQRIDSVLDSMAVEAQQAEKAQQLQSGDARGSGGSGRFETSTSTSAAEQAASQRFSAAGSRAAFTPSISAASASTTLAVDSTGAPTASASPSASTVPSSVPLPAAVSLPPLSPLPPIYSTTTTTTAALPSTSSSFPSSPSPAAATPIPIFRQPSSKSTLETAVAAKATIQPAALSAARDGLKTKQTSLTHTQSTQRSAGSIVVSGAGSGASSVTVKPAPPLPTASPSLSSHSLLRVTLGGGAPPTPPPPRRPLVPSIQRMDFDGYESSSDEDESDISRSSKPSKSKKGVDSHTLGEAGTAAAGTAAPPSPQAANKQQQQQEGEGSGREQVEAGAGAGGVKSDDIAGDDGVGDGTGVPPPLPPWPSNGLHIAPSS